jgi:NAD(P)-dependent dehydrogenase (short-subunit alcohol dehydrogenase family)
MAVAVHHRDDERGAEETATAVRGRGPRAAVLRADLRKPPECERLVEEAEHALGGIDLLVNNAGVFRRTSFEETTVAEFDEHFEVHVRAAWLLSRSLGRRMATRGGGAIVNIACASGLRPWAGFVPYSASKAAMLGLTRGLARALAPAVRVNAVAPGPILPAEGATDAENARAAEATVLARWGEPADIAAAVMFLASASYLTGVILAVDGGRSIA